MKKILAGLTLCAAALLASDGAAIYGKCASCHGKDGKNAAVAGMAIGGEAAADVEKKLKGYKDGSFGGAKKAMMTPQVANLSDADIKAVAAHIAGLK